MIERLIEVGLAGSEIDPRDNNQTSRATLHKIAERYDLIVTGASDFHGAGKENRIGENTTTPEMLASIHAMSTANHQVAHDARPAEKRGNDE
jgi:hypothetical protein